MNAATQEAIQRIQNSMCPTTGLVDGDIYTRTEGRISEADLHTLISAIHRAESALGFYARHEHWMALTSDADALRTVLVAMQGAGEQHGWRVAEDALLNPTRERNTL